MYARRRVEALEGAVKKADGVFARCKCMQHENRCYEMDHPLQAKLVREGPGRAAGVLWASVMNADGVFARYNHTGCEIGQGLGSQWPIRMRQGGRERDEKGPFLSPP